MICLFQCRMALSALIERLVTLLLFLRSIMMSSGDAASLACCRTQTK